ncbi:MAG: 4Fe-4S dicluster domain-containing protein [Planctomycetota bacterium]
MLQAASVFVGVLAFVALACAGVAARREEEPRAAGIFLLLAVVLPVPYLVVGLVPFQGRTPAAAVLLALTALAVVVFVIPTGRRRITEDDTPQGRIDERDVMFSRARLAPGSPRFEAYYAQNPEKKASDDAFRAQPGLLARDATMYHPYAFAAADATFWSVEHLRKIVDGDVAQARLACDPQEISGFIKRWALKLGAVSVGVTGLEDYHLYTHVGRGEQYGQPVKREHDYAIAFTVEMAREMIARAPKSPITMESSQQYLRAGAIAVQIAAFIRAFGYPARAHIDGDYRVVCPLVARDAGLGEIGRMGLLMTPKLGPRVRLGVVTTDLPLPVDERRPDHTTIDFCQACSKCADICPSQAISFDGRARIDGVVRWQIDSEACYGLWTKLGTDCGRCVAVCPYAHPDNLLHNLVRAGVRNSSLFRRLAIRLDDVFYGKRPPSAELPEWMKAESVSET